jgi:putative transposase
MPDHIHMCLGIPPKYDVANTIGKLKGKSAILIHQRYGRKRNFVGLNFRARGYCVSTVGLDERRFGITSDPRRSAKSKKSR